jgi:hypothetical protein
MTCSKNNVRRQFFPLAIVTAVFALLPAEAAQPGYRNPWQRLVRRLGSVGTRTPALTLAALREAFEE